MKYPGSCLPSQVRFRGELKVVYHMVTSNVNKSIRETVIWENESVTMALIKEASTIRNCFSKFSPALDNPYLTKGPSCSYI